MTQLADADQCAILHLVTFPLAPEADITQLFIRVIPRAVDCSLDAADLPRVHVGRRGGEGVRDVAAEVAIPVRTGNAAGGFGEGNPLVGELVAQFSDLARASDRLSLQGAVADDFRA